MWGGLITGSKTAALAGLVPVEQALMECSSVVEWHIFAADNGCKLVVTAWVDNIFIFAPSLDKTRIISDKCELML